MRRATSHSRLTLSLPLALLGLALAGEASLAATAPFPCATQADPAACAKPSGPGLADRQPWCAAAGAPVAPNAQGTPGTPGSCPDCRAQRGAPNAGAPGRLERRGAAMERRGMALQNRAGLRDAQEDRLHRRANHEWRQGDRAQARQFEARAGRCDRHARLLLAQGRFMERRGGQMRFQGARIERRAPWCVQQGPTDQPQER